MAGIYAEVKTIVEEKQENTNYVHCAAHKSNLVPNNAVPSIFKTLIYLLYSWSLSRVRVKTLKTIYVV